MSDTALSFLLGSQVNSQGWGYQKGHAAVVEATAAVLLYLRDRSEASEAVQKALRWLEAIQNEDGGWGINGRDTQSGWQSAWAILALTQCGGSAAAVEAGIRWLVSVDAMRIRDTELLAAGERVAGIDFFLRGWPWLPGEASWVEPTAISMLALKDQSELPNVAERLEEAVKYLEDRRCPGGGWNVGNPVMFDATLPARAVPTAWSLIALNFIAPSKILSEDISVLRREVSQDGGILSTAWGLLALRLLGEDHGEMADWLKSVQNADGSWSGSPYLTAVSCLALEGRFW